MTRSLLLPRIGLAILAAALVSCTTPDRAVQLTALKPPLCVFPYHCNAIGNDPDPSTLVIVSASGGGSRAAAALLGSLLALDEIPFPSPGYPNAKLLDQVDIISSVSGGSITAAAFGLDGRKGLARTEQWLRDTSVTQIVLDYANPKNSIGNWFPGRAQIDVLVDMFADDDLYGQRTFESMAARPYVVLNSADMGAGAVFSFTQPTFDLICSDLTKFQVAEAVAGSAAYPIGFGALSLRNHSYPDCPAHTAGAAQIIHDDSVNPPEYRWPPADLSVQHGDSSPQTEAYADVAKRHRRELRKSYFYNPRWECSLVGPSTTVPECKQWLHLLDGGMVENLGISAPLDMITDIDAQPSFATDIATGRISRIVLVVVNARNEKESTLETSGDSPGWIPQLLAVTGSLIDATSNLILHNLSGGIRETLIKSVDVHSPTSLSDGYALVKRLEQTGDLPPEQNGDLEAKLNLLKARYQDVDKLEIVGAAIDFDFIPTDCGNLLNGPCDPNGSPSEQAARLRALRRYMKSIATNWWLEDRDIDLTRDVAKCLVKASPLQVIDPRLSQRRDSQRCFMDLASRVPAAPN